MAGYKYFTVLTDVGKQKLAEAIANETALDFTEMAVGDSNGTSYEPTSDMTALKHVTYRAAIGSMKINAEDKNIMEFEFVVPASTGGFYVREAGLYSNDGTLIAISRLPEQYKADMAEGAGSSMTVRILVAISSNAQIYITVPASITYATQTYVIEEFKKHKAEKKPHAQYVILDTYNEEIDELEQALASKADSNHRHDDLYSNINHAHSNYAASNHNHDATYLKKTDASSTYATKTEMNNGLAGKAASNHTHSNYAANNHNHDSVYSKTNHTHSNYASSSHNHDSVYLKKTDSISLPVGFIYIQLRGQSTPDELFGSSGKWQDISNTYAGEFFRAVGGNSGNFGNTQAEGLPNITGNSGTINLAQYETGAGTGALRQIDGGIAMGSAINVINKPIITFNASLSNSIYGASTHVTPYNSAVRIWKKIA